MQVIVHSSHSSNNNHRDRFDRYTRDQFRSTQESSILVNSLILLLLFLFLFLLHLFPIQLALVSSLSDVSSGRRSPGSITIPAAHTVTLSHSQLVQAVAQAQAARAAAAAAAAAVSQVLYSSFYHSFLFFSFPICNFLFTLFIHIILFFVLVHYILVKLLYSFRYIPPIPFNLIRHLVAIFATRHAPHATFCTTLINYFSYQVT